MTMKLGKDTGSLVNYMMGNSTKPTPEVGMGCTLLFWSDRYAGTIIKIENNIIHVQQDNATRIDKNGISEDQEYEYTPNPKGAMYYFRIRKGKLVQVRLNMETNRWNIANECNLSIGTRRQYYDFSF